MSRRLLCVLSRSRHHPDQLQHRRTGGRQQSFQFRGRDFKAAITAFLLAMLERAYRDSFPLHIREVERIAQKLAGVELSGNEQVEPWAALVVAADGGVSTFSPEFMEMSAPAYDNFVFGNILDRRLRGVLAQPGLFGASREIERGVAACKTSCRYFAVCGGGSPVNKFSEKVDMPATETDFCRLTTQTSADALLSFLTHASRRSKDWSRRRFRSAKSEFDGSLSHVFDSGLVRGRPQFSDQLPFRTGHHCPVRQGQVQHADV